MVHLAPTLQSRKRKTRRRNVKEAAAKKLMDLVGHPLVAGRAKRAGIFWFTISPLFTDPTAGASLRGYLDRPDTVFDSLWTLPDGSLMP